MTFSEPWRQKFPAAVGGTELYVGAEWLAGNTRTSKKIRKLREQQAWL